MYGQKILVAEDEGITAADLEERLQRAGYRVPAVAHNAEEAISQAEATSPDLVLMDINMPGPIDGTVAADTIRKKFDIPVIYLTALSAEGVLAQVKRTEPYGYILKPFNERELLATIEIALTRHEADQRVRDSEERLRLALAAGQMGTWDWDIYANKVTHGGHIHEQFGIHPGTQTTIQEFFERVHPKDRERIRAAKDRAKASGREYAEEFRVVRADGAVRWIASRGTVEREKSGRARRMVGVSMDITEMKQREEQIRVSEEFRRRIIDASRDNICVLDLEGHLVWMNDGGRKGMEIDDFNRYAGAPWVAFWKGDHHAAARRAADAAVTGKDGHFEGECATAKGTPKWWSVVVTPILGAEGRPVQLLAVARDITALRQREEQIRLLNAELEWRVAERTKELEAAIKEQADTVSTLSHDLRSPARAATAFAEILLQNLGGKLTPEDRQQLQAVRDSGLQMGRQVDDLLAFLRLFRRELKKETVAPEPLVRQTLEELRGEREGRTVEIVVGALPNCQADPHLLQQLLLCLLSNAHKFTRKRTEALIEIGAVRDARGVTNYFVRDNGVGIDMRYADRIFGMFTCLNPPEEYEGTGTGLALAQRIVQRHGGRIWVESAPDRGATFHFTLDSKAS